MISEITLVRPFELAFYRRCYAAIGLVLDVSGIGFRVAKEGRIMLVSEAYGHGPLMRGLALLMRSEEIAK